MLINYKDTRKEIIFQIQEDLFHMKVNGLYSSEEVEKLRRVLFAAEENFKHYAIKEHGAENMKQYDNLLKEMIILAENRLGYTQLEKYGTMVGVYALISYVESPLYYLHNINLSDFEIQKLMDLADVVYHTPTEYLSVVCPILVLPELYEYLGNVASSKGHTIIEETKAFVDNLIQDINQYRHLDENKIDPDVKKRHQQLQSLLHITSECADTFFCSKNLHELNCYNEKDQLQGLNYINELLELRMNEVEYQKTFLKK